MAENGNGASLVDAALQERVRNLSDDVHAVRGELQGLRHAIEGIATQQARQGQPQWQALGVMLTAVVVVGGLAWWPIRETTQDTRAAVQVIAERAVTQRQHDADMARITGAMSDTRTALELLRTRSYEHHGAIAALQTSQKNVDGRLDAISRRLAEFIRDMGKH